MPTDRADGDNDGSGQGFSTDTRRVLWIVRYSGTNLVYLEGGSNLRTFVLRLRADRGATTQNSRLPRRGGNTGCTHFNFISLYIFRQTLPVVLVEFLPKVSTLWLEKNS